MKSRVVTEQDKIIKRVYKVDEYLEILKDVMEDIITQTNFMGDEELDYDRNLFIRNLRDIDVVNSGEKNGYLDYDGDIHTLSILCTQLLRFGKILYKEAVYDEVDETKEIDDDFFDEREFDEEED